ncbi:MAG: MarR family transcriptional regulator [Deltaproteobacteria bacterium]|nr:MarR family transcriptional regulator [Deltaproteobacteria bacterium]NIS77098.1 MarR family transcriptional regulator [Deltaproteobacteria bacterium]
MAREKSKRDENLKALMEVIDETRGLFHRMAAAAQQIHRQGEITGGRRGVLMNLQKQGPLTVPSMARQRPVSRQHIQTIVNGLREDGFVELIDNPAHKRSRLVTLTPKGEKLVEEMNRLEARILSELVAGIPAEDLERTAAVLRSLKELFSGRKWYELVERYGDEES